MSQQIIPRKIIKRDKSSCFDPQETSKNNQTEFFCKTLQEKYNNDGIVKITIRRAILDRSDNLYRDEYLLDNFPNSNHTISVYFDLSQYPHPLANSSLVTALTPINRTNPYNANKDWSSVISKVIIVNLLLLSTLLLLHHFFEINIQIRYNPMSDA